MADDERPQWTGPSRSQLKRDAEAVRKLGERLTQMTDVQLSRLPLDEDLRDAIAECHGLKKNARLRQLRSLGAMMRGRDLQPLREALGEVNGVLGAVVAVDQQAESWRTRLLADGDTALAELLDAHPNADGQRIRQLARQARSLTARQPEGAQAKRARRELLRALRDLG